jgi:hypothetical protein
LTSLTLERRRSRQTPLLEIPHLTLDKLNTRTTTGFVLRQNYPNPATTIEFALPEASHVKLSVFNVLGKEVAGIVDAEMGAGVYRVSWDANGVASGVYLFRLIAGDFVQARKMALLK